MYFKSTEDMSQLFYDLPESISNTQYIAERCNLVIPTDNLALFPKYAATSYRDRCNVLTDMAYTGAQTRLAHIDEQRKIELYFPRLEYELATIISRGYVDYFLTVADFTNWAHKNNIPVGPGRGSGASSLLAFCLNITSVDPIRYKLLFERFLNIERESYPDFDIDFCFENRERIIDYIKQRYGANKVAQIISHSTLSAKIVLKDVCRVMGIKFQEANNMTKFISIKQGTKLLSAIETSSFLKKISSRGITKLVFKHSLDLEGIVRGSTRHAAGIIISHCPIEDLGYFCHGDELEHKVVQWDMISLEKLGFLKCDILGLRTLTSIQKTIELVAQTTGKRICFAVEDSLDDRATYDFIHTGNTDGIFQLESPGMQSVLQQLPVSDITDIIAIIALYRPGPMRSGMLSSYINIKNEKKAIQALHPLLNDILNETYGLIIYQEQIMQTARIMSGFSLGAGDKLQRVISKKQIAAIESFQTAFIRGAIVNGIEEGTAISVFNIIKEFAEYGFNKAHATSYAILTYYTAFLKLHHTVQFYIALLSTESTQINKYLVAALCDYINILPPCINDSYWEFTYVNNNTMRFGLGAVKGIGYSHYLAIENERKLNGKFQNLYDFINRVFKGKTAIKFCEILVECGALDCFLIDKDKLILQIELIFKKCKQANIEKLNSLEPWIDYPVRGSDYFSKKENMRLTINLSYNILKMHNFWLARIGNTSYISRRQVYNHVGVLLEWHAFHERIIIKTLFNREIRYFFLSPDKFCNKITAGSLMIFHSYQPLYVHSFYHKKFANCISCSTIEDLINQTINQILISISYEKIDMLIKALEYCFSYHKDNNLFLNTVTLKVIVKNNISNGEYLLQKEIKVSAYSLIQMLQPNFTLNYVFRN
jgi:DNA polymerase-3 subunit alpha